MRNRKDILNDYNISTLSGFQRITENQQLILEVLLDIRENLKPSDNIRKIQSPIKICYQCGKKINIEDCKNAD